MKNRVYKYGMLPPTAGREIVDQQIKLRHKYQNKLVEIELRRRKNVEEMLLQHSHYEEAKAAVEQAEEAKQAADEAVKQARAHTRQRKVDKTLTDAARTAKANLKEAKARCKQVRDEEKVRLKPFLDEIYAAINQEIKDARAASGCYWGTYSLAERAMDLARKSGSEPRFHAFRGNGAVAVQIQGSLPVERLFSGKDTRVQIDPVPASAWDKRRSKEQRTYLRLRVGSNGREPIWAEWPLILHRPIPPEAEITWATAHCKKVAGKERWTLHLTLRLPDSYQREKCGKGTVAVDLGWRKHDENDLRVAYVKDDNGAHFEFCVDSRVIGALTKANAIQSQRDKDLDELRSKLVPWIKAQNSLPEWFQERIRYMAQWKAQKRFAGLAINWRSNRWPGDDEGYEVLEAWRARDKHLWLYQENSRDQALAHRKNQYRNFAAQLARAYDTLVLEDFDLREVAKKKDTDEAEGEAKAPRRQRQMVACSELRECLIAAFIDRGGQVFKLNPAYTTQECHACGSVEPWDAAPDVWHKCAQCGSEWDQDHNATINLLRRYRELFNGRKKRGAARANDYEVVRDQRQSKWEQLGRHRKGARKDADNPAEL